MARRKKKQEIDKLIQQASHEIATKPEYSLVVDPTNKYEFTDEQKKFIENFVQLRNVEISAQLSGLDPNEALSFALSYNAQEEVRRINKAIAHRQFSTKMANLDEIGGYLTSLLTGENLPFAEILSVKDKIDVAKLLIKVNELQQDSINDPSILMGKSLDFDLNDLSVKTIKSLLENMETDEDVRNIDVTRMSPEEVARVRTQPKEITELMGLLKKTRGGKNEQTSS